MKLLIERQGLEQLEELERRRRTQRRRKDASLSWRRGQLMESRQVEDV